MRRFNVFRLAGLAALVCLSHAACKLEPAGTPGGKDGGEETGTSYGSAERVAAILIAANDGEIAQGQMAAEKAVDPRVKDFGSKMIADHTEANRKVAELLASTGTAPQDSAISRSIKLRGAEELNRLSALSGEEFDQAYIQGQIALHRDVLSIIDDKLIPNAESAPVRRLLADARGMVAMHLELASSIH